MSVQIEITQADGHLGRIRIWSVRLSGGHVRFRRKTYPQLRLPAQQHAKPAATGGKGAVE